jgi:hypothetical protein
MITHKTLPEATAQEVFDQVVNHLRKQGKRSMNNGDQCVYLSEDGSKCAAGCFVDDPDVARKMDSLPDSDWLNVVSEGLAPDTHGELICKLQRIHDYPGSIELWEKKFEALAKRENLVYTPLA